MQFLVCPILMIPKKHLSIYRSRNSVQIGLSIVEPVYTLFFSVNYFSVGRLFPLPSALLSTGIERWKVFGMNTLRRRQILPETTCRPTFQLSNTVCTTFAGELRKRSSDGMEILIENWATFSKLVCDLSHSCYLTFSQALRPACRCAVRSALRYAVLHCVSPLPYVLRLGLVPLLGLELIHTVLLSMKICWFDE